MCKVTTGGGNAPYGEAIYYSSEKMIKIENSEERKAMPPPKPAMANIVGRRAMTQREDKSRTRDPVQKKERHVQNRAEQPESTEFTIPMTAATKRKQ